MSVTSSNSKTQWAQPEDWAKFQNTITALFMCHSLPVVMRIMREEHKFHATPKMFQTQIYQKWGLRKTKPGEAKREAKERKRRREESEEADSNSSVHRDRHRVRGSLTAETVSVSGRSQKSDSPSNAGPSQMDPEERLSAQPSLGVPTSHIGDNEESSTESQNFVPASWTRFLGNGQVPLRPLDESRYVPASIASGSLAGSDQLSSNGAPHIATGSVVENDHLVAIGAPAYENDADTWISTVMTPTQYSTNVQSSVGSYAESQTSKSSRASQSLPSNTSSSGQAVKSTSPRSPKARRNRHERADQFQMPLSLIRQLNAPDALLHPEKNMFVARHFISTTFSTGIWAMTQGTDAAFFDKECASLEKWYNDFNPGFEFLKEHKVTKAFRLFKRCFANTKAIIEPQDPRVVIYVFQQVIRCMYYDRLGRGLSQTLLKYITGLCQVIFGPHHPLYIILNQLSKLDAFEFALNIRPFMDCYFDHLEPFLEREGSAFGHITEMRGLTVSLMEGVGIMGIYEAKPILDRLVKKADRLGLPSMHLKVETAAILNRGRFFDEAVAILVDVRRSEEGQNSPYEWMYAGIILMVTYRSMKATEECIRLGYELMEFLTKPLTYSLGTEMSMTLKQYIGSRQSSLLLVLGKLEKELRDSGRVDEADRIQARLDGGISDEYGVDYGKDGFSEDPIADVEAMV